MNSQSQEPNGRKILDLFAEQKTQFVFLITAEFQFLPVGHHHAVVSVEPGLNLADALQVHDGGTMDAYESVRIKLCFHLIHVAADEMRCCAAVQAQIVAVGFNPIEVAHIEEE